MIKGWRERKLEIEKRYGEWISYDIASRKGKFYLTDLQKPRVMLTTIHYFERVANFAEDFLKIPLSKAKVLDLACADGIAAFAFSQKSKSVTGIDGRHSSIVKARFAQKLLGLNNIKFKEGDVRKLVLPEKSYDVVLALGILYHLDVPDIYPFIKNLYKWTKQITIIDTQTSLFPDEKQSLKGKDYFGIHYDEFEIPNCPESSIGNNRSFWLTKSSLLNILRRVGYTNIYEYKLPKLGVLRQADDRVTLIASKGLHQQSPLFHPKKINNLCVHEESNPLVFTGQYINYKALKEAEAVP